MKNTSGPFQGCHLSEIKAYAQWLFTYLFIYVLFGKQTKVLGAQLGRCALVKHKDFTSFLNQSLTLLLVL